MTIAKVFISNFIISIATDNEIKVQRAYSFFFTKIMIRMGNDPTSSFDLLLHEGSPVTAGSRIGHSEEPIDKLSNSKLWFVSLEYTTVYVQPGKLA